MLFVSPATVAGAAGSTVSIDVHMSVAGDTVNAVEADLTYPAQLTFDSVTVNSPVWGVTAAATGGGGTVTVTVGTTAPVTGDQLVATITFTLSGAGSFPVDIAPNSAVISATTNTDLLHPGAATTTNITTTTTTTTPATTTTTTTGEGGGGGSGGIPPDLHVDVVASSTTAPSVGSELDYAITVSSKNVGSVSETTLKLTLPSGYAVTGIVADRGPGCTGAAPNLTCNTAFINPTAMTHLRITGTVGQAGEQDLTASVTGSPEPELNPSDNTVTLKLRSPTSPPPVPGDSTGSSAAPGVLRPPVIGGVAKVGRTLFGAPPKWTSPPAQVSYQWQLCLITACHPIAGAIHLRLRLLPAYSGKRVRLTATARIHGHLVKTFSSKILVHA